MAASRPSAWPPDRPTCNAGATCMTARPRCAWRRAAGAGAPAWEALGELFAQRGEHALAAQCLANALRLQRGEDSVALVRGNETPLRATVEEQPIAVQPPVYDANEERDEFGNPRLP
ncbi:hypothetical protein G6F24_016815 [Rhizopus arrhizus]|nr:hypothetical protein G6F24_016815 [Rhizopus arrhizus]